MRTLLQGSKLNYMTDTAEPTQTIDHMIPSAPTFDSIEQERQHRKERLASVFRVFSKFGFEGDLQVM